ncbi:MAG: type III pantothenate kinase [Phycisphaerae bacterium]
MIAARKEPDPAPRHDGIALLDIGNSTVALGIWSEAKVQRVRSFPHDRTDKVKAALKALAAASTKGFLPGVAVASVVPDTLERMTRWIEQQLMIEPLVVGRQIPLPIEITVEAPETVGVDRVCNAAAAFEGNKRACVVVDCGTAITIDVVDDDGALIGGAIYPGLKMQAAALHRQTAVLPQVTPIAPPEIIGSNTVNAICSGIYYGTAGAVRGIVEAYATHLNRWPDVIATGGDAELLSAECNIFDAVVPNLCLIGIGLAYNRRLDNAVTL